MLAIRHLTVVSPSNEKRTVEPPVRLPNSEYRTREYLTEAEVKKLIEAAREQPLGPPRHHNDPAGLQARPARVGAGRPSLGAGRPRQRNAARP